MAGVRWRSVVCANDDFRLETREIVGAGWWDAEGIAIWMILGAVIVLILLIKGLLR